MAEFPYMPLWTDAYLADTRHLETEEHGAYFLLLLEAWRRPDCNLPDDDAVLARLVGLNRDRWDEIKPVVMAFWTLNKRSKTWSQKRQTRERTIAKVKSEKARNAAVTRWYRKKKHDADAVQPQCENDAPIPIPIPTIKIDKLARPTSTKTSTRLPDMWKLPDDWLQWAVAKGLPEPAAASEGERFHNYYLAAPGDKGVKRDWLATWRNWVTTAIGQRQTSFRIPAAIHNHGEIPNHGDSRPFPGGIIRRWDAQSKEWILPKDWRDEE